jgi:predicted Zn-dependent protease
MSSHRKWIKLRIAPGLASLVIAMGLFSSSSAQFARPSAIQQVQLGKQAAKELRQHEKVLPASDGRVQALRRVARRILSTFDDRTDIWEYSFDVIDSKEINAFALPGGPTFFYTGLMDRLKTEDELAAVLGHELTHVRKEHWSHAYRDQENRSALMTLGALVLRPSQDLMNAAGITSTLMYDLPFSRRHENEADQGGYEAMIAAGYNPQGMVDVFKMLGETAHGDKPPEFLSDHPTDKNRVHRMEEMISHDSRQFPPMRQLDYKH